MVFEGGALSLIGNARRNQASGSLSFLLRELLLLVAVGVIRRWSGSSMLKKQGRIVETSTEVRHYDRQCSFS
jgi:hypothetical protein